MFAQLSGVAFAVRFVRDLFFCALSLQIMPDLVIMNAII